MIREITVAAKEGGPSIDGNPRLRQGINAAKKASMPKDVIDRAINKGAGADGTTYTETVYEGYGPAGVAIIVECTTDNINRTVANLRTLFNKGGGSLGTSGSVSYLFERKSVFNIPQNLIAEDALTEAMIEAGADDIETEDEFYTVTAPFELFGAVSSALQALKIEPDSAELERQPLTTVALGGENMEKVLKLIENLEDNDDVQKVFHNLEITEAMMAEL